MPDDTQHNEHTVTDKDTGEKRVRNTTTVYEPKTGGGNFLTKKFGFLPVWAWAIVVVGGILYWRHLQNANAANAAATTPVDSGITPSAAPTTPDNVPTSTTPTEAAANNLQWEAEAVAALKRLGYHDNLINTAMQRYFAGEQLDEKEEAAIETAINLVGQPPAGGHFGEEVPPKKKAPTGGHHPKTKPQPRQPIGAPDEFLKWPFGRGILPIIQPSRVPNRNL